MASRTRVVVPLRPGSDGDATHRPVGASFSQVDPPTLYLEKLADQWMKRRGEARPGVSYILERLPDGYALFQKPREKSPSHIDKWLYGSPNRKVFDSPNRFFPHFLHLMENDGSSIGCPCTVCNTKGGYLPKAEGSTTSSSSSVNGSSSGMKFPSTNLNTSIRTKGGSGGAPSRPLLKSSAAAPAPTTSHKGRPKSVTTGMDTSRVDEEGTPDVYRNLIDRLKRQTTLDEAITETMSMDWRAEQAVIPDLLEMLTHNPQWSPRAGDIVLYIRELPEAAQISRNRATGRYELFDPLTQEYLGSPSWEAGLVSQVAETEPTENLEELSVSLFGVRVEPMPDPNGVDKSLSKRYKYIGVNQTRPFMLWRDYLDGIPHGDWHPTIGNALTAMATMCLVGRYRFKGNWPDAQIYCHGIYIGSEMLVVGDTVRLLPKDDEDGCSTILVIKSIRLKLSNLDKSSSNDYDEGRPYNSGVWICGNAYTTSSSRSYNSTQAKAPKSASGDQWFPMHPPNKELSVPFSRIIGRLYEREKLQSWLLGDDASAVGFAPLDLGREAIQEARSFARRTDQRITSSLDATWFWADSRSEALDLRTINGLEVAKYDLERDPKLYRQKIKVIEGVGKQRQQHTSAASASAFNLRGFVAPTSLPVHAKDRIASGASSPTGTEDIGVSGVKRSNDYAVKSAAENREDEIRQGTRIVVDDEFSPRKKARVMVIIG